MKFFRYALILLFIVSGCSFLSPRKAKLSNPEQVQISGNIVNKIELMKGGKIAFTDLKAGPSAIADELTDKLSLKIIEGVSGVLQNSPKFEITSDPHDANFIFEGYIEEFTQPGKISRLVLFKNKARISVSGEIYNRKTGLRIISFGSSTLFKYSKSAAYSSAHAIGEAIGQFINKHALKD